jgi:hypothetical protein
MRPKKHEATGQGTAAANAETARVLSVKIVT